MAQDEKKTFNINRGFIYSLKLTIALAPHKCFLHCWHLLLQLPLKSQLHQHNLLETDEWPTEDLHLLENIVKKKLGCCNVKQIHETKLKRNVQK